MVKKEINLLDYCRAIWKHKKFIIIFVSLVTILALFISLLLPKWYRATAVIMPPEQDEVGLGGFSGSNLAIEGLGGMLGVDQNQLRLLAILKSESILDALDKEFNLQEKFNAKFKFQTYEEFRSNLNIRIDDESQIKISLLDKDQDLVADMVNYIVHCLDSLNISLSTSKGKNNRKFIEDRMRMVRDSLISVENKISDFMENNNIINIEGQLTEEVEKAADMQARIMAEEVELDVMKTRLTSSETIVNSEVGLKILKDKYDEFFSHPGTGGAFISLDNVPEIQKKYSRLKRKEVYFSKLLEYLAPQYEQAKIQELRDVPTIQVIDWATRPEWKSKPKRAYIVILSLLVSFMVSILLVLTYEGIKN